MKKTETLPPNLRLLEIRCQGLSRKPGRPLGWSLTFMKSLKSRLLRSSLNEVKSVVTEVQERKVTPL